MRAEFPTYPLSRPAHDRRRRLVAALLTSMSVGLASPLATAEPLDVGAEIPGPAGERAADSLGDDWIRSEAGPSEALEADALANSERQRALVDAIAREQLGEQIGRTTADLRTLQRILDEKRLGANPDDTLQALGVVLGDVLVAQGGFKWIGFNDQRGRSRALRSRDGKTVAFPVTAIARVVKLGHRADVAGIYDELLAMGGGKSAR